MEKDRKRSDIMDWCKITLPPSVGEIPDPAALLAQFGVIYRRQENPKGFCVFFAASSEQRTFYLSPIAAVACSEYIRELSGVYKVSPCDAPATERFSIELRVGDFKSNDCQDLLKYD